MLALLTALVISPPMQAPDLGPAVPPGSSTEFQSTVLAVETALQQHQWSRASALLSQLPKPNPVVLWDDSKVPVDRRSAFSDERDLAIQAWRGHILVAKFVKSGPADLKITFEPVLASSAETGIPLGSTYFRHNSTPQFESVIGLKRGRPMVPISIQDVHNEVAYAFAMYAGLAPSPLFGTVSGRTDLSTSIRTGATGPELGLVEKLRTVIAALQIAVNKKTPLTPAQPDIQIDPREASAGSLIQGEIATYTLQITNRGNSPLSFRFQPECGCILPPSPAEIGPGEVALIHPRIDTTEYFRFLTKKLFIISNDPDHPILAVPLSVNVVPRFRFIAPSGSRVVIPDGGKDIDVYLSLPTGSKLQVTGLQFDGIPGSAVYESWDGDLADLEMGQPKSPRHGYHFTVSLGDALPPGRSSGTLVIRTNDRIFPNLRYNIYAQKGIIALPDELFWGDLPTQPKHAEFLVTRPGLPFKLKNVKVDSPYLKVTLPTNSSDELRVSVDYNGKAPSGDFRAVIRLFSDDIKQPEIDVRVRATAP